VGERFERNTHQLTAPIASSAEGGGPAAGKIPFMVYSGEVPRSLHGVKGRVSAWNRKQRIQTGTSERASNGRRRDWRSDLPIDNTQSHTRKTQESASILKLPLDTFVLSAFEMREVLIRFSVVVRRGRDSILFRVGSRKHFGRGRGEVVERSKRRSAATGATRRS
jgi:hypothetical protein